MELDLWVLRVVRGAGWPWLDRLMMLASNRGLVAALVVVAAVFLWRRAPRPQAAVLVLLLSVGISEAAGALLLKPWARRPRPCRTAAAARTIEGCDEATSFPASSCT